MLQVDAAKVGLRATLLVRNNGKYLVNLDPLILCFLREAECLGRMGLELPPEAIELQFMRSKIRTNFDLLTVSCIHNYTVDCDFFVVKIFLYIREDLKIMKF